jgi:hypothetical protein
MGTSNRAMACWIGPSYRPVRSMTTIRSLMPCHGVTDRLSQRREAGLVLLDVYGFHEDPAVEFSEDHLGASLGAVDADEGQMLRTDRLNTRMNHAVLLVNGVGLKDAKHARLGRVWDRDGIEVRERPQRHEVR